MATSHMIAADSDAEVVRVLLPERSNEGTKKKGVYLLDRHYLTGVIALVGFFIGSIDVNKNEVEVVHVVHGVTRLSRVVGIDIPSCAGYYEIGREHV